MFKSKQLKIETSEPEELSTLELIDTHKELLTQDDITHIDELFKTSNRSLALVGTNWKTQMLASGFSWQVDYKFVNKFKYAAQIHNGRKWWEDLIMGLTLVPISGVIKTSSDGSIRVNAGVANRLRLDSVTLESKPNHILTYIGDIPNFALSKIETAKTCGSKYITIHSMEPMPTKVVITDPVVLAWRSNPYISVQEGSRSYMYNKDNKAFVVAAWDLEKELI